MNPDWLRYFVTLADAGNFRKAAEQLSVTSQALSKALAGLEKQLGVVLVERGHSMQGLTPAGEILFEEAQVILRDIENARLRLAEWGKGGPQGPVTVAGEGVWLHYLLPSVLAALLRRHPRVRPRLFVMVPEDVEQWVAAGEVELGMLLRPPRRPDLDVAAGLATPYVIVARPQPPKAWQAFKYIVPRGFRRELADQLDGWPAETPRRVAVEVELLETALALCEAGVGAAFVPQLAVRDRIRRGTLAVVAEPPRAHADHLHVIWRKGIRPTRGARALLQALERARLTEATPLAAP